MPATSPLDADTGVMQDELVVLRMLEFLGQLVRLSPAGLRSFEAVADFSTKNPHFVQRNNTWQNNVFSHHQYGWLQRTRE